MVATDKALQRSGAAVVDGAPPADGGDNGNANPGTPGSATPIVCPLDRAAVVERALGSIRRFAMLPEVTLRIVEIVNDPDSGLADLHRVVATDPALCLRILKVANSAFYGLSEPLTSIERAIALLGGNAVRNIALAASLGRLASNTGAAVKPAKALWRHSLAVGAGSRLIAEASGRTDADEAFLCGLLHDVGFMVELQYDAESFTRVMSEAPESDHALLEIEERAFGANHQDFGNGLCVRWQLPARVGGVLGGHHSAGAGATDALADIVHLADALAGAAGLGFIAHATAVPAELALILDGEAIDALVEQLPATTAQLQEVLR